MSRFSFAFCCLFVLSTSGVGGQTRLPLQENKWEVSFFFGLNAIGDSRMATPVEGGEVRNVDLEFDAGHTMGIRITENLGQHFGAELEYARADKPLTLLNLGPRVPRLDLDQGIHQLVYSGLFYPRDRDRHLRPFVSLGVGGSLFRISGNSQQMALAQGIDLKNRWKLALSYGAGVKYQRGPGWGFRLDFRDQVSGVPDFGLPRTAILLDGGETGVGFRPEGVLHHWQISGGVVYSFGIY